MELLFLETQRGGSCGSLRPPPQTKTAIHPSRPRGKRASGPHAKLLRHSNIFPWRQGERASERYLCQCATQPECLIGRRVACTREAFPQIANNLCLSVCLSRPRPSVCLAIRPARPDGIRVRIRNVYRWRRPRVSVQFLSDGQTAFQELAGPNLDL